MITPQRTVDIALAILRKDILEGKYPPLTLLPSERKLSETLSINRQTLRSASRTVFGASLDRTERARQHEEHASRGPNSKPGLRSGHHRRSPIGTSPRTMDHCIS